MSAAPDPEMFDLSDIFVAILVDRHGRAFSLKPEQIAIHPVGTFQEVADPASAFTRLIKRTRTVRNLAGGAK